MYTLNRTHTSSVMIILNFTSNEYYICTHGIEPFTPTPSLFNRVYFADKATAPQPLIVVFCMLLRILSNDYLSVCVSLHHFSVRIIF